MVVNYTIKFQESKLPATIQASDDRCLICTRTFDKKEDDDIVKHRLEMGTYVTKKEASEDLQNLSIYTIVDLEEEIRGGDNYTVEQITADVLSFISLKENWDGFGAYPLEKVVAVNALSVINPLGTEIAGNISDVYPNSHGTVSCEWESESSFLSLEIGNSTFSYYKEYKGKTLYYDNLLLNDKNILTLKNNLQSFV